MSIGDALEWKVSSFSGGGGEGGSCVEVAPLGDGGRVVRNSNDPDGPVVSFTESEWAAFIKGAQAGEFGTYA